MENFERAKQTSIEMTFFKEEYKVRFTNGKAIYVYVDVVNGINEKNNHQEAEKIAAKLHPDLDILSVSYC